MGTLWLIAALLAPDGGLAGPADAGAPPDAAAPLAPSGPPPKVDLSCAPQPVRVGDPLTCTLVIDHRPDVTVKVVAPAGATRQGEAGAAEPAPGGGLRSTRVLTLKPFGLDDVKIRGFQVVWQETSGYEGRVEVPALRVPVKSLLAGQANPSFRTFAQPPEGDAAGFFARHGPLPYVVTNWPLIIGLIALCALLIGGGAGFAIRRWLAGRAVEPAPFVDPRPAHVIAYERLERLQALDLPGQGEAKAYYFRLSEIVREYLGRRYGFEALELTSHELMERLSQRPEASVEGRLGVQAFLDETDLVKFADFTPADDGGDTVLRMARGLIELTRSRELAAPPEAPQAGAS